MSLFEELKRRNVIKVAVAYTIVAWLLLQVASTVFPIFDTPRWVMPVFTVLLAFGFPLALVFAWAFELTADGIRREKVPRNTKSVNRFGGRRLDFAIIALLGMAVTYFVTVNYIITDDGPDAIRTAGSIGRSIAVLPFRNRSALAEDAFFVDGIHDDILTRLATISSFDKIISRTSVEQYRATTVPIPQIGQELGVAVIIEGGVQRAGDRVRINVQLIDAATDDHQWAATYERKLTAENVFAIQAEIADAIVNELQATLSPRDRDKLNIIPTNSMEALEHYFRGQEQLRKRTSMSMKSAIDHFQSAVAIDPKFALAHTSLAEAYSLASDYNVVTFEDAQRMAREHATRALALDAELGGAYSALGSITSYDDPAAAESAFRKAIDVSPNNVSAHYNYCWLLGPILGKYAAALERCEKALELDPLSPIVMTTTGSVLWGLDRPEEARLQYERASETDTAFVVSRIYLGYMDWYKFARLDQSVKWLRKSFLLDTDNLQSSSGLGMLYLDLGDTGSAAFWINEFIKRRRDESGDAAMFEALLHMRQGDTARATELAHKHFEPRKKLESAWTLTFLRDDALKGGRSDDAREVYARTYPELLDDSISELTTVNFQSAIDLALVLYRSGEQQQADTLISLAQGYMRTMSRTDPQNGFGLADVKIHAILGRSSTALSSLREAIDEGWRYQWWLYLEHDLALEVLRNEPEFQEMIRELEADMTAQLAHVREMEANGELAPIPE